MVPAHMRFVKRKGGGAGAWRIGIHTDGTRSRNALPLPPRSSVSARAGSGTAISSGPRVPSPALGETGFWGEVAMRLACWLDIRTHLHTRARSLFVSLPTHTRVPRSRPLNLGVDGEAKALLPY